MSTETQALTTTGKTLDEKQLAWLALALAPGLGPKRILDAVQQLGSAARVFELRLTELEGLNFPAESAQFIFDGKARAAAESECGSRERTGSGDFELWVRGLS